MAAIEQIDQREGDVPCYTMGRSPGVSQEAKVKKQGNRQEPFIVIFMEKNGWGRVSEFRINQLE